LFIGSVEADLAVLKRCLAAAPLGWGLMPEECRRPPAHALPAGSGAAAKNATSDAARGATAPADGSPANASSSLDFAVLGGSAAVTPPSSARIIAGSQADISSFPYQMSLVKQSSRVCGASLIAAGWAITAAHCVPEALEDPNTNIFRLVYGSTDVAYGLGTGKVSERSAYVCVSNVDLSD
jgi:V8-like Glu-specific endopeptidase